MLIQLFTVIVIGLVLTAIIFRAVMVTQRKGRDTKRLNDMAQIQKGLDLYLDRNGLYPPGDAVELGSVEARALCDSGWQPSCEGETAVMTTVPKARGVKLYACQEGQDKYMYTQLAKGKSYEIVFCMEADYKGRPAGLNWANETGMR